MSITLLAITTSTMGQNLNKMNWLNEPQQLSLIHILCIPKKIQSISVFLFLAFILASE